MRRLYVIGFPLLMAFDTLAQLCFKYAGDAALPVEANTAWLLRVLSQPWVYGAILGYVGAFFTWMSLLRHAPIGPAFAASHLEVISVLLLSAWLTRRWLEPLSCRRLVSMIVKPCAFMIRPLSAGLMPEKLTNSRVVSCGSFIRSSISSAVTAT